ncbi:MAG: rhomboid family intramembrane serine protease [Planctomycetales bacterium]|nr:rhomboid family intramembrane serine protease [Planctomycetales bacterium]
MRQIGHLSDERQARRFTDFLATQGVSAHLDKEDDGFAIWVRDEEHVAQAAAELADFRAKPDDQRYLAATTEAAAIRRQEAQRRKAAAKNVVEMRGGWSRGRRAPATFMTIAACVLVGLATDFDFTQPNPNAPGQRMVKVDDPWVRSLLFVDPQDRTPKNGFSNFASLSKGEVWRAATPVLLHGGPWHLLFNMYWLWFFGSQIEDRRGKARFLALVLLTAVLPNLLQATFESPMFGGMSGVGYGLFGYVWMRARFDPQSGLSISPMQTTLLLLWFFACFTGMLGPIANTAHGAGLFVGVVAGYAPVVAPAMRKLL